MVGEILSQIIGVNVPIDTNLILLLVIDFFQLAVL